MGVPLLYRWLTQRYPLINRPASSLPHAEVDNLYIDCNGILHNCTHGANKPPPHADGSPPSEADMMIAICSYLVRCSLHAAHAFRQQLRPPSAADNRPPVTRPASNRPSTTTLPHPYNPSSIHHQ